MKTLILSLLLSLPLFVAAQSYDSLLQKHIALNEKVKNTRYYMYDAGWELDKFARVRATGTILQVAGAGTMGLGLALGNQDVSTPVIVVGGAISFIGGIVALTSHKHIRFAGAYLKEGGLVYPIKKKDKPTSGDLNTSN
jgi:hypothetical protein